jgi:hypothetical protein
VWKGALKRKASLSSSRGLLPELDRVLIEESSLDLVTAGGRIQNQAIVSE